MKEGAPDTVSRPATRAPASRTTRRAGVDLVAIAVAVACVPRSLRG
jgi:hypothetical protein